MVEAALAQTVRSPTEAAYARSDLFERRRRLMDDLAEHLNGHRIRLSERVHQTGFMRSSA